MKDWPSLPVARRKHYLVAFLVLCVYFVLLLLGLRAGLGEKRVILALNSVLGIALGLAMVVWPLHFANGVGYLFWCMGKYTLLGKTGASKQIFVAERPFWFRVFGVLFVVVMALSLVHALVAEGAV